ncbi:U6 snRNA-associated Sm-like protein LSm3 [Metopolophium dirhodum]|uniref:U6 snRNA-associated Sm-like protein LSm3 n=1 Tax=Metopolophium dirhodum TaxID=44670 RepID=UPI00299029D4|nr:U6 snRNA-associated Sm-like protein LSm3 [Metopolophium dirhodum]
MPEGETEQEFLATFQEQLDFIRHSVGQRIYVKMHNGREIRGRLYAFDPFLSMVLGEAEETITKVEVDEETFEEVYKTTIRPIPRLIIKGFGVMVLSLSSTTS